MVPLSILSFCMTSIGSYSDASADVEPEKFYHMINEYDEDAWPQIMFLLLIYEWDLMILVSKETACLIVINSWIILCLLSNTFAYHA